jgi:NADH-quinone oxidoreductase subunit F
VIYRRERKDMPAIAEEVDAAEEEGVKFIFLASPHRIVGDRGAVQAIEVTKTRLGAFDTSGRRRPIDTGEVQVVPCNAVILAVGEVPETEFATQSSLALKSNGMLDVDRYELTTSRDKVYAGGDFVSGASNVVTAMSYGKEAARSIDRQLTDASRFEGLFPTFQYDQAPPQPSPCARHHAHFLPPAVRAKTFDEAVSALRPEEAHAEASRCLRCDIRETVAHAISRA